MMACFFTPVYFVLLPTEDAAIRQFPRLLRSELQRAICESHLWLSLWEKPPRSPFTRLQRATCCALLLQLILLANTLWYSIVVDKRYRYCVFSLVMCKQIHSYILTFVIVCVCVQPKGCGNILVIKWRDSGSRCRGLSSRLPTLSACIHTFQNEPQQGKRILVIPCWIDM